MTRLTLHPAAGSPRHISKDETLVGRDPIADLVVADGSVSRKHAQLLRRSNGWNVLDQGSANGTFLDSHRVAEATLRNGQELRFGMVAFRVELEDEEDTSATLGGEESGATVVAPAEVLGGTKPIETSATVESMPAFAAPPPPPAFPRPRSPGSSLAAEVAAPGAAPRKGKGPVFWVLMGCGGCLTMVFLVIALIAGGAYFMTRGPVVVVEAEVADVRAGNLAAAYARLSSEYRTKLSRPEFEALVEEHPALKRNASASFGLPSGSVQVVNDKARVTGLIVASSGEKEILACELVKESGEWRISFLAAGPAPGP